MRSETRTIYEDDTTDYIERLMIAFYVRDGWDRLWPWGGVPAWLWPRYNPTPIRQAMASIESSAWWPKAN